MHCTTTRLILCVPQFSHPRIPPGPQLCTAVSSTKTYVKRHAGHELKNHPPCSKSGGNKRGTKCGKLKVGAEIQRNHTRPSLFDLKPCEVSQIARTIVVSVGYISGKQKDQASPLVKTNTKCSWSVVFMNVSPLKSRNMNDFVEN
jgi:hypothetical protein